VFLLLLVACGGLPECEDLCDARAACVAAEIDANESTWEDWTGYSDQQSYRDALMQEWQDSLDAGTDRDQLRTLCKAEQQNVCDDP
jgi:hypothetical protein